MSTNLSAEQQKEVILKLLAQKSVMKQDVFANIIKAFSLVKDVLQETSDDIKTETTKIDSRISVKYTDVGAQSAQLKVAGDVLDFYMHTNVFEFDRSHPMFKTGYIKQNELNSFCGIINIYNFLADSFKYHRLSDLGYLACRIFVNKDMHFFVETRINTLAYKYSSFSAEPLSKEHLKDIINELIIFAVSFDLFTPPFDAVKEVSVHEIQEKSNSSILRTGKRLGYGTTASYEDDINL
jgi:hypothetical protein